MEYEGNEDDSTLCTWHKALKTRTCETKKCGSSMEIAIEKRWLFGVSSGFANNSYCPLCHLSCKDRQEIQLRNSVRLVQCPPHLSMIYRLNSARWIISLRFPSHLSSTLDLSHPINSSANSWPILCTFWQIWADSISVLVFMMRYPASLPDNLNFIRILETLDL